MPPLVDKRLWLILLALLPLQLTAQKARWDLTGSAHAAPLLPYDLRPAWAASLSLGAGRTKFDGSVRQAYLVEFGRSRRQTNRYQNLGPEIADEVLYFALRYQLEVWPFQRYGFAFELGYQNSPGQSFTDAPPDKNQVVINPQWGILTGVAFAWRARERWHLHAGFRLSAFQLTNEEINNGEVVNDFNPFEQLRHVPMLRLSYRLPLGKDQANGESTGANE